MLELDAYVFLFVLVGKLEPCRTWPRHPRPRLRSDLIAATSIVHNVPLRTRDRKMLRSKVVPLTG